MSRALRTSFVDFPDVLPLVPPCHVMMPIPSLPLLSVDQNTSLNSKPFEQTDPIYVGVPQERDSRRTGTAGIQQAAQ